MGGSQQQLVSNGRSKVTRERAALVVLGVLLAVAVIALGLTSYKNMEHLQKLTDELDAVGKNLTVYKELLQNLTDEFDGMRKKVTDDSRLECEEGWEKRGGECYYFSTDKKTWDESRRDCRCRGGNLVRIGSREEQEFLVNRTQDLFWIGLTDSKKEGTWLWTDGSPLDPSLVFWRIHEPNNWGAGTKDYPDGEDCVEIDTKQVTDLKRWFDYPCFWLLRYVCDKSAKTSHLKCV